MLCSRKIAISLPLKRSGPPHSIVFFFEQYSKNLKLTLLLRFHDFYQISVTKEFQQKIRKFYPSHFFGALFQNDCKSYENILSERNNQNETCQIFLSYILTKFQKRSYFYTFLQRKKILFSIPHLNDFFKMKIIKFPHNLFFFKSSFLTTYFV